MICSRHRRAAAFTLFEVVLAAAILVVGLVALIQAVSVGAAVLDVAQKQTVAGQIIHGELERIHRTNFNQVMVPGDAQPVALTINSDFHAVCPSATATELVTLEQPNLKKVSVTVTWIGNTGRRYTRTGFTYSGNNGLYVAYQR